jgi:hypothetical protein
VIEEVCMATKKNSSPDDEQTKGMTISKIYGGKNFATHPACAVTKDGDGYRPREKGCPPTPEGATCGDCANYSRRRNLLLPFCCPHSKMQPPDTPWTEDV